jgi:protein kinase A
LCHSHILGDSQNFQRYPPPKPADLPGILGIPQGAADDPYKHLFNDFVFPPAAS